MAVATETIASETEIKQAMRALKLDRLTDELLDEIELNRRLKNSLEQDDRGEVMPIGELKKQVMEKFASGYYSK
jgi:hypothetical protein